VHTSIHAWYERRAVAAFTHRSVLVKEVIEYLSPRDNAVYVDCTVGGGGHTEAILGAAKARVIGIDRDPAALAAARERLGDRVEPYARKIARMIKEAVLEDRLHTTTELAAIIARAIPTAEQRKSKIHPATRTFQALRIAVNRELDQLAAFLDVFPELLAQGGR